MKRVLYITILILSFNLSFGQDREDGIFDYKAIRLDKKITFSLDIYEPDEVIGVRIDLLEEDNVIDTKTAFLNKSLNNQGYFLSIDNEDTPVNLNEVVIYFEDKYGTLTNPYTKVEMFDKDFRVIDYYKKELTIQP